MSLCVETLLLRSGNMSKYKVEMSYLYEDYLSLSHDEFLAKMKEYQLSHDLMIKEELVFSNLKLVLSLVQKFNQRGYNLDDLFQVGIIGLIKAIDNFDLKYNVRFSTYAVPLILGEIKRYIRDNTPLRISRSVHDLAYHILVESENYMQKHIKEPSLEELSQLLNVEESFIIEAIISTQSVSSLSSDIQNDGEKSVELIEQLPSLRNESYDNFNRIAINDAMIHLDNKERYVIEKRYYEDFTQNEIAHILQISQAQVSRVEKQALENMRKYME